MCERCGGPTMLTSALMTSAMMRNPSRGAAKRLRAAVSVCALASMMLALEIFDLVRVKQSVPL